MNAKYRLHTGVLVLGSGPSGFAAAYTAAKHGADVVLVEQCGDVGGISTSGLMSHWTGSCGSSGRIAKMPSVGRPGRTRSETASEYDKEDLFYAA